ncbi:MAG: sensor histidine kinase [Nocardioides sp.]
MTSKRRLLDRHGDTALGAVLGSAGVVELLLNADSGNVPAGAACMAVAGLGASLRRKAPLVGFMVVWVALFGASWFVRGWDNDSIVFVVLFFVSLYSLGAHTRGRSVWAAAALVVLGIVVFSAFDSDDFDAGDAVFGTFFVGGPWAAGLAIRLRRDRERTLIEENELAVARERARIARELHDVVAHAISVTVVQARGGRAMLGRDEDAVRRALDAIEQTNTAALSDMRRLLAVLRDTDGPAEGRAAPQPSLANLDLLVEQVRGAGLPVEVEVAGDGSAVPPGVDLSAYRIVQEALTNVIKHAGPGARARVRVAYSAYDLEVTVTDDGSGRGNTTDGGGHGLAGIRERVAVVGGRVEAGPSPDGGFAVAAHLPYALETQQTLGSRS